MKSRIDYGNAHFNFDWSWIKDKQIIHKGNEYKGMLIILDEDGVAVGMYGYEAIDEYEDN
jgi:hypothetical protein